jgi:hypothetical protein
MKTFIEITLIIIAWKKGWRWFALLPFAIVIAISFCIGIGMEIANPGYILNNNLSAFYILDVIYICILLYMCFIPKK